VKKKLLVVANWKLNPPTLKEAHALLKNTKRALPRARSADVIICPPLPFLFALAKGERSLAFGAQDVSAQIAGAYTGEVSATMLKSVGASYAIIGHSERRALGESDAEVSKKLRIALDEKITPILCVGELERDEQGSHLAVLADQLTNSLASVLRGEIAKIIIAYEPVWAIGRRAEDALDAHGVHGTVIFIRKILSDRYGREYAEKVRILYGGSVEPGNVHALVRESGVSGFLVGHASLLPASFAEIIRASAGHA
jgi:triosephosphate isomerase (TIM)